MPPPHRTPRERVLSYLATVDEARPATIRARTGLALPLYRLEQLLRELAREGLVARRDAHVPLHAGSRIRRHAVLYRLARPAGGGGP